ncbi:MAG TPA: selenide, water dikinase SelD [Solirubrobacteraceae bacterium]|jgi:selenide,water dikinase|nr:selenide, water dikinase SelD [Solirubrobacteraceae bacterium]
MAAPTALKPSGSPSLTALSRGAGCGCKLAAADLLPIVRGLPFKTDERLLVGSPTSDDAAVFHLRDDLALVQTVDFFTPLVDDPYDFGRIAAANALSDVYAMGGKPLTAMNIVAFPLEKLGGSVLREILRGGLDVVSSADAILVGGHSIDDTEPKYGLAVTGIVNPAEITTNAAGRPGDVLMLTKPLGVGAIVTARKHGNVSQELLAAAIEVMITLNDSAAKAALRAGVRAMTDVTGFGLLGHLHHLCRESGLSAEVDAASVPAITGVDAILDGGEGISGGSRRNAEWATTFASIDSHVETWRARLLTDATTSGGLLVAVPAGNTVLPFGSVIGRLCAGPAGAITVR